MRLRLCINTQVVVVIVYGGINKTLVHESIHRSPAKSKWINLKTIVVRSTQQKQRTQLLDDPDF